MLQGEDRFMMKELYRRGVSMSEIARRTGHDRKTVRAALARPVLAPRRSPPPRASKLDPYAAYLERRVGEGVLNAQKLFREVVALGYTGKRTLVRSFVQPFRAPREPVATVRFETEPGEQAQVDWAHFGTIEHRGRQRARYAFLCTLGWSRALHLEFTVSTQTVAFLRCHVHAFRALGGVPRRILYDNLKSVVLDRTPGGPGGAVHWNPTFLDFADYYGFGPQACRPYRAQTKGKVERGVGYVRGDFWQGMAQGVTFTDLADLNRQAREWAATVANRRVHGTTGAVPPSASHTRDSSRSRGSRTTTPAWCATGAARATAS
jgi:transposase